MSVTTVIEIVGTKLIMLPIKNSLQNDLNLDVQASGLSSFRNLLKPLVDKGTQLVVILAF